MKKQIIRRLINSLIYLLLSVYVQANVTLAAQKLAYGNDIIVFSGPVYKSSFNL